MRFLLFTLIFFSGNTLADEIRAKVLHCSDADTCRIAIGNDSFWTNVRLFGIDAPEVPHGKKKGQPLGLEARDALNAKIKDREVRILQADLDPYNRPVVEIQFQQENVNLWLVSQGWAEVYQGKTKRIAKEPYFQAESAARKLKKGIWALSTYESPRDFRHKTP